MNRTNRMTKIRTSDNRTIDHSDFGIIRISDVRFTAFLCIYGADCISIFQNVKKIGPPRRAGPPAAPQKFASQKVFGPPVLSAIQDQNFQMGEVNLKRQTFIPIQATMPKTQLPVISTPKHVSGLTFVHCSYSFYNYSKCPKSN